MKMKRNTSAKFDRDLATFSQSLEEQKNDHRESEIIIRTGKEHHTSTFENQSDLSSGVSDNKV